MTARSDAQKTSTVNDHSEVFVQIKEARRVNSGFAKSERQVDDVLSVTARAATETEAIARALTMLQAEADRMGMRHEIPMELP